MGYFSEGGRSTFNSNSPTGWSSVTLTGIPSWWPGWIYRGVGADGRARAAVVVLTYPELGNRRVPGGLL